jgi:hypothetical protein
MLQRRKGLPVTDEILLPGVLTWEEYQHRRATWDAVRQCIGLDAEFWLGAELLLFPPDWLTASEQWANELIASGVQRIAKAIGIDPAEGGDKTSMCAIDELGIIELVSRKTPNTDDVPREAVAFMRKHGVSAENVCFDRGGGGKQHADRLRASGFSVRTVGFGEAPMLDLRRGGKHPFDQRKEFVDERLAYATRRVEMYWETSALVDITRTTVTGGGTPVTSPQADRNAGSALFKRSTSALGAKYNPSNCLQQVLSGQGRISFAIPSSFTSVRCEKHGTGCLRAQLAVMPKQYKEGKCVMPPKDRPSHLKRTSQAERTLVEMIGHSPDESDSLVLAVHAFLHKPIRTTAGVPL